jgi:ATP-dependent DNA ligase
MPPVSPMLAKPLPELPGTDDGANEWLYDPKWDGFRSIVFRDGDEVVLGSRNEKPLTRYFPELVEAFRVGLPERCVLDGEILVEVDGVAEFDVLGQRIHPADSRVKKLAAETPARFIAFDLLALGDRDLRTAPLVERRALLQEALQNTSALTNGRVSVTPATTSRAVAADWFVRFEAAGCDGIIAKKLSDPYVENKRTMIKVKHQRTADCVIAGFRWHKAGGIVGSLLLGLYDHDGRLHHVGVTAAFTDVRRRELVDELDPYRSEMAGHPWAHWAEVMDAASTDGQRVPGGQSRWTGTKDLSFVLLRPELVCEVAFDHMQGDRFRHAATFKRWRSDRDPLTCTYEQLEVPPPCTLAEVLAHSILPG